MRPTEKTIAINGLQTTNNLVVVSRLFPLQLGGASLPEPTILWFPELPLIIDFWQLDRTLLGFENRALYAPANASGSTLDFGVFCTACGCRCMVLSVVIALLFIADFLRDPDRAVPPDPNLIVAAADGAVMDVIECEENQVLKTKTRRVGIFLSIFDVHTNRAPIDGKVTYRQHQEGLYLDARRPDCSEKNESMTWAFENSRVTIVVRQITGAIARRIVAWAQVGDELKKGDRFGMIRFGSRTELYLPLDAEVLVKTGDHVSGGSTIIARLSS
jgi:phosphatidylserine decarboxylase